MDRGLRAQKMPAWPVFAAITLVGVFYLSTIRHHDGWADFAQYLAHARNIATGAPYSQTGYIYNPHYSSLGPSTYPPVFPLLLAPVYRLFPENLTALRVEMIFIFLLTLWVLHLNFQHLLPDHYRIAALLFVGLSPVLWEFKDELLSDIPFLLFTYVALFLVHRSYLKQRFSLWQCGVTGVALYLAYGTRSIGVVLVASLFLYDLIRNRRPTAFMVCSIAFFLLLAALQALFLPGADYSERITRISLSSTLANVLSYARFLEYFWHNGYSKILLHFVSAVILLLIASGWFIRVRNRISIYEVFAVLMGITLLLYPAQHHRYLFPLFPLVVAYALYAIHESSKLQKVEKAMFLVLVTLIFGSYAARYTTLQFTTGPEGVHKSESVEVFRFVRENTSAEDVIIFRRPRALAFFTGRKASVYHRLKPDRDGELWEFFRSIDASYIIESYFDEPYFRTFLAKNRSHLKKMYENRDFTVYRIGWSAMQTGRWSAELPTVIATAGRPTRRLSVRRYPWQKDLQFVVKSP